MQGGLKIPLLGALGAVNDTVASQARPLLPWGWAEQELPLETETGQISAALAGVTVQAQGSQQYGQISATLDGVTVQATGSSVAGPISATLDGVTASASGAVGQGGPIVANLDGVTVQATGNAGAVSGPIVAQLAGVAVEALGLAGRELPYSFGDAAPARASPPSATGADQVQLATAGASRVA